MINTDPTTGLPTFAADQSVEQIPLGNEVFPFADLDSSGRMRRQPIYGDDVVPTSALLVGMDNNGTPRAGTMDAYQNLWTKESQFQSFGQVIPDGGNGPIDVNLAGNSVGVSGGSPYANGWTYGQPGNEINTGYFGFGPAGGPINVESWESITKIIGLQVSCNITGITSALVAGPNPIELMIEYNLPGVYKTLSLWCWSYAKSDGSVPQQESSVNLYLSFVPPIDLVATFGAPLPSAVVFTSPAGVIGQLQFAVFGYS